MFGWIKCFALIGGVAWFLKWAYTGDYKPRFKRPDGRDRVVYM